MIASSSYTRMNLYIVDAHVSSHTNTYIYIYARAHVCCCCCCVCNSTHIHTRIGDAHLKADDDGGGGLFTFATATRSTSTHRLAGLCGLHVVVLAVQHHLVHEGLLFVTLGVLHTGQGGCDSPEQLVCVCDVTIAVSYRTLYCRSESLETRTSK